MASIDTTSSAFDTFNRYALRYDLTQAIERIKAIVRNPSSDSYLAVILVACIALTVAILVILLLIVITPSPSDGRKTRADEDKPESPRRILSIRDELNTTRKKPPSRLLVILTGNVAVVIFAFMAMAGVYFATSTDRYCSQTCHSDGAALVDATEARHAHCIQCHEGPLLLAAVPNSLARARMVTGFIFDVSVKNGPSVDSSRCLNCHGKRIAEGVLVGDKGIAMSHAELLTAGTPCTRCHRRTGHDSGASTAEMSDCSTCHDSVTASAECDTCHRRSPAATVFTQNGGERIVGTGTITYSAVRAARRECGLCHNESKSCDPCHGVRLPHSKVFIEGGHSSPAAFERAAKCYKCHSAAECARCHPKHYAK